MLLTLWSLSEWLTDTIGVMFVGEGGRISHCSQSMSVEALALAGGRMWDQALSRFLGHMTSEQSRRGHFDCTCIHSEHASAQRGFARIAGFLVREHLDESGRSLAQKPMFSCHHQMGTAYHYVT